MSRDVLTQIKGRIDHSLKKRLDYYCTKNGYSYSKVINQCLRHFLEEESKWEVLWKRLDKMTAALNKSALRTYTFGEAFLYWTQYFFAYSPDLDDNEKSQANIKAKMRYERFVQALITRFQKARAGKEEILTEKIWNEEETA